MEERRNITVDGVRMPLGIAPQNWPSATILAYLAGILAVESLGIHADVLPPESSIIPTLLSIAGCGPGAQQGCEVRPASVAHATFEAWDSELAGYRDILASSLGDMMPEDLGSVGYDGQESMFLSMATSARGEDEGLPLDFYSSYNASWHTPSRYFHKFTDIPTQGLLPCSETKFYGPLYIDKYFDVSGDAGGVEVVGGARVARCVNGASGSWWLAPACRDRPETCIPVIDSGDGWWVDVWMQRAAVHNMPLALAVATWDVYAQLPRQYSVLFAWWKPDSTFIDLSLTKVKFPAHNQEEWSTGNTASDFKPSVCRKWVHPGVFAEEMRLRKTFEGLSITPAELDEMLANTGRGMTEMQVACEWLKAHPARWTAWAPAETSCFLGWGLADRSGSFVANRSEAITCQRCPSGRYSRTISGNTHICDLCSPGAHQPNAGQVACELCDAGTYADGLGHKTCHACARGTAAARRGSAGCEACGPGSVQPSVGMLVCEPCIAGSFQAGAGATACESCLPGEASGAAAAACRPCAAGSASGSPRSAACAACAPGRFAEAAGRSRCSACAVGSFANTSGGSACEPCGGGAPLWTTARSLSAGGPWVSTDAATRREDCSCAPGARLEAGRCVACTEEGVACPSRGEVVILAGYYSAANLSVFQCRSAKRCRGGRPGATCDHGRQGIACARCPAGTRSRGDASCAPCEAWSAVPAVLACACGLLGCTALYLSFDAGEPGFFVLLAGACGTLLMSMLQQLSALGRFGVSFQEPLRSFLEALQVVAFDLGDFVLLGCVFPVSALADFGAMLFLILSFVVVLLAIHVIVVLLRHRSQFRERQPALLSSVGSMMMLFFTPLVVVATRPFQCSLNPNGQWTVQAYEEVICWSSDESRHTGMLIVGLVGLAISGLFFAMVVMLVRRFPLAMRTADMRFLERFGVFFRRLNPRAYWYVIVFMLRGMMVSLIPIVPSAVAQVYAFQLVTVCAFVVVVGFRPWRSDLLNFLDGAFSAVLLQFVLEAALQAGSEKDTGAAWLGIASVAAVLVFFSAVLLFAVCKRLGVLGKRYQFFLCFSQAEAGAFARWLQFDLADLPEITDICVEADALKSLDQLLLIIASDVERFLVVGSPGFFARSWCIAELAAAHQGCLPLDVIALAGFQQLEPRGVDKLVDFLSADNCLAEVGIRADVVRQALLACSAKMPIRVPVGMDAVAMSGLTRCLVTGHGLCAVRTAFEAPRSGCNIAIIADASDAEAGFVAHLLAAMLTTGPELPFAGIPVVLPACEELPAHVDATLILVTEGCFRQQPFVLHVLSASDRLTRMIPIIADSAVQVPSRVSLETSLKGMPLVGRCTSHAVDAILELFFDIAVVVDAKRATRAVLNTVRDSVASRLAAVPRLSM